MAAASRAVFPAIIDDLQVKPVPAIDGEQVLQIPFRLQKRKIKREKNNKILSKDRMKLVNREVPTF